VPKTIIEDKDMPGPFPKDLQIGSKLPNIIGQTQLGFMRVHDYMDGAWGIILTFPETHHPVWMTVNKKLFFFFYQ
jgi:hypothetical protein